MRAVSLIAAAVLAYSAVGDAAVSHSRARASPVMSTASKPSATNVEGVTAAWDRDAWMSGYRTAPSEDSYTVECADLPADLVGTFFRNAPAKFEVGDEKVMHPFDADGMISALTLDGNGKAHFRNRFVRTRGFVRERQEGKMLYPGTFGNPRGFWNGGTSVRAPARCAQLLALASLAHLKASRAASRSPLSPTRRSKTWPTQTCCGGAAGCSRSGRVAARICSTNSRSPPRASPTSPACSSPASRLARTRGSTRSNRGSSISPTRPTR
jgi:hypothetical protein